MKVGQIDLKIKLIAAFYILALLILIVSASGLASRVPPALLAAGNTQSSLVSLPQGKSSLADMGQDLGKVPGSMPIRLVVLLSLRDEHGLKDLIAAQNTPGSADYHKFLSPEQFLDRFGPTQQNYDSVANFLVQNGFAIEKTPNRQLITATGTAVQAEQAFNTELHRYKIKGKEEYASVTAPQIPVWLSGIIKGVQGLDSRKLSTAVRHSASPAAVQQSGSTSGYTPLQIETAYDYPILHGSNGSGRTIAVATAGDFYDSDLQAFETRFGYQAAVTRQWKLGNPVVDDMETTMDVEWSTVLATGANELVYIIPATNGSASLSDFTTEYNQIVTDNKADAVTSSWGACEISTGASLMAQDDSIFMQGVAQGQTWFVASGDYGCNCDADGSFGVQYPASSPYVTAMGGTTLQLNSAGGIASEIAWNDHQGLSSKDATGGGTSLFESLPSWEYGSSYFANGRRWNSDFAMDADYLNSGMLTVYNGTWYSAGGTSIDAPFASALAAEVGQHWNKRLGIFAARINQLANSPDYSRVLHDITSGDNSGFYTAFSLAVSPNYSTDQTLFAGTGGGGAFKSTDGGSNWSAVNTGLANNLYVYSLAVSPAFATDHTLFAGTYGGGVFKSTDGGSNWSAVNTGLTNMYVYSLAVSPGFATDHTLFAGSYAGVFKSTDGGASWSAANSGFPANTSIQSLAASPDFATDHTIFAGTRASGVYKSTDAGVSWSAVNTGLTDMGIWALAVSPGFATDHTLFAGTTTGVFKSTDAGASWSAVNTGLTNTDIDSNSLILSPNFATDHTLFAGTYGGGVFKSTDAGASWSASGFSGVDIWALAISPNYASDNTIFAGPNSGSVYKSADGGASWTAANSGFASGYYSAPGWDPPTGWGSPDGYMLMSLYEPDTTPPTVSNVLPTGSIDTTTTISADYSDSGSGINTNSVIVKLDGSALSGCTVTVTHVSCPASALAHGAHTISGSVSDNTGNTASINGSFTVVPRDYYWTWYDNVYGVNWVLLANPPGAAASLDFSLSIAGTPRSLPGGGVVTPGKIITPTYPGIMGGPVVASSLTGGNGIVSQRVLWAGGSSLEEVPGTGASKLSDHYYWTWYDQSSSGFTNWILIANPSATESVHAVISFTNLADGQPVSQEGDIAPGGNWNPTFPGKMGGPVEVKAYLKGGTWPADKRNVIASQRVLSSGGSAFNEVPGIPAAQLSDRYLWTWYDNKSPGASDWVLIANPGVDSSGNPQGTVTAYIRIAGVPYGPYTIAPGNNVTPTFPGKIGGPVEVWTDSGNVIASQRSFFGPSFEEVPGLAASLSGGYSALAASYYWTWYDQQSPGMSNWVLVVNPGSTTVNNVTVKIAGTTVWGPANLGPGQSVTPTFPGQMGGPVQVDASGPVMASQRVLYNGYFNEVLGTVLG